LGGLGPEHGEPCAPQDQNVASPVCHKATSSVTLGRKATSFLALCATRSLEACACATGTELNGPCVPRGHNLSSLVCHTGRTQRALWTTRVEHGEPWVQQGQTCGCKVRCS